MNTNKKAIVKTDSPKPEKPGRPTKYKPEYAEQARKLCLLGSTDAQLAQFLEVYEATINRWKLQFDDFCESVKGGKMIADAEVAAALYKRALGFTYDEVIFEKIDGKVNLEVTPDEAITTDAYKKKIVTKMVVPDTGAAMNWLKNRQKDLWRDNEIDYSKLTDEQLDKIISRLTSKANDNP